MGPLRQLTDTLLVLTISQLMTAAARVKSRAAMSFLETAAEPEEIATGEATARDMRETIIMNFISRIGLRASENNMVKG